MTSRNSDKRKKERGWVRPAVAVAGFFVILFLSAYLVYRFHLQWLIPVGIIAAFIWAIGFSIDWTKNKNQEPSEKTEDADKQ